MEIEVEIGAAVLNDCQTEIGVGCFEQSGEDILFDSATGVDRECHHSVGGFSVRGIFA